MITVQLVLSGWVGDVTFGVIAVTLERVCVCVVVTTLYTNSGGFPIDRLFYGIEMS